MSPEEREFYQQQWPHFKDDGWIVNNHRSFGSTWWIRKFGGCETFGQYWEGRIGFHVGNNWSKFWLNLTVGTYPKIHFSKDLDLDTATSSNDEVCSVAAEITNENLERLANEAKEAHDKWWAEEVKRKQ